MNNWKRTSILGGIVFLGTLTTFAADITNPFSIQYVQKTADLKYTVHMANPGNDSSELAVSIGGTSVDIPKYLSQNTLEIGDFLKSNSDISITKNSTVTGSGQDAVSTKVTEKSDVIKLRQEDRIMLKPNVTTSTTTTGKNMTFISLDKNIGEIAPKNNLTTTSLIPKKYSLNINGADQPLEIDNGEYADGKYYISNNYILFPTSNITTASSVIKLKIDGVYSNYIILRKEIYKLDNPKGFLLKTVTDTTYVNWVFDSPSNATDLGNFSFYINGTKLDKSNVTVYGGEFTVNYPASSVSAGSVINIYIADSSNNVSNTIALNADDYLGIKIDKISLGDQKEKSFLFEITGNNPNAFYGDMTRFTVNINGQDYTYFGTQVALTESGTSTQKTDYYGNVLYETQRKIDIRKAGNGINFNFYYSQFGTGEVVLYVKNDNIGRTSNKVSFKAGDYSNINYNHGAAAPTEPTKKGIENVVFEKAPEIISKKIDFLYKPLENIPLGKITIKNLETSMLYNVSFKIRTNLKVIPFSHLTYNSIVLTPKLEDDGTISYIYTDSKLGSGFSGGDLTFTLTDLFNLTSSDVTSKDGNTTITLSISDVSIKKYNSDQKFEEIFTNSNLANTNIAYQYEFGNCFDGGKDFCTLAKLTPPALTLSLSYSAIQNTVSPVAHTNKQSDIPTYGFKNEKFNTYNQLFKKFYENAKNQGISTANLEIVKTEIKNILSNLKGIEDKTLKAKDANKSIKNSILEIKRVLKK